MTNTGQQQAIERFIAYWDEGMAADLAPRLTCGETEAIADLFTACERRDLAAEWINQHSYTDDSGDSHHRSTGQGIRYELATITESIAVVELAEEDPSAFLLRAFLSGTGLRNTFSGFGNQLKSTRHSVEDLVSNLSIAPPTMSI